jgi:hypothetical protein
MQLADVSRLVLLKSRHKNGIKIWRLQMNSSKTRQVLKFYEFSDKSELVILQTFVLFACIQKYIYFIRHTKLTTHHRADYSQEKPNSEE